MGGATQCGPSQPSLRESGGAWRAVKLAATRGSPPGRVRGCSGAAVLENLDSCDELGNSATIEPGGQRLSGSREEESSAHRGPGLGAWGREGAACGLHVRRGELSKVVREPDDVLRAVAGGIGDAASVHVAVQGPGPAEVRRRAQPEPHPCREARICTDRMRRRGAAQAHRQLRVR